MPARRCGVVARPGKATKHACSMQQGAWRGGLRAHRRLWGRRGTCGARRKLRRCRGETCLTGWWLAQRPCACDACASLAPAATDGVHAGDDGGGGRAVHRATGRVGKKVLVDGRGRAPGDKFVDAARDPPVVHERQEHLRSARPPAASAAAQAPQPGTCVPPTAARPEAAGPLIFTGLAPQRPTC